MSHSSHSSHDDNTPPFGDAELESSMQETLYLVQHLEPKVREMNRLYRDLLGAHPESADGNWVYLARDEHNNFVFAFETISVRAANLHTARVGEQSEIIQEFAGEVIADIVNGPDLGSVIVGEAAALVNVPRTHVRLERYS